MSQSSDADFSLVRQPSVVLDLKDSQRDTNDEVHYNQLSGDEAAEKSFTVGSMHSLLLKDGQKATIFLSGITIMKSMVGVGILGLPNVAKNFGIIPMIVIVLIALVCTNFSSSLLVRCKNLSRHSNFTTIGYFVFETKTIIVIINLIMILSNFGTCLAELIIFGTTFDITIIPFYFTRWFLMIVVAIFLIPLLTVKSIEKLRFVSLVAIISVLSFTSVIIWNFFTQLQNNNLAPDYGLFPEEFNFISAFGALPNVVLAFNWHFNQFPVYKGMITPTDARIKKAAWLGSSLATALYLCVGILGYMTYGNKVETNFLNIVQVSDVGKPLYIFLNVSFTLSTTLTIPVIFFASRNNCISLVNQFKSKVRSNSNSNTQRSSSKHDEIDLQQRLSKEEKTVIYQNKKAAKRQKEDLKFYIITFTLEILLVTGAIFLTQLDIVFNFLGAVTSNAIGTGLPSLFYIKCIQKVKNNVNCRTPQDRKLYYIVRGYFIYSLLLVVICVGSQIFKIEEGL